MLVVKNHHGGNKVVNFKFFARVFFYTQGPFRVYTVMFKRLLDWLWEEYINSPIPLELHNRSYSWLYWVAIWSILCGAIGGIGYLLWCA